MDKKQPVRTCVCCRRTFEKNKLLRVIKTPSGEIELDFGGKKDGRGAYICGDKECLKKLKKSKALSRALKTDVPAEIYDQAEAAFDGEK